MRCFSESFSFFRRKRKGKSRIFIDGEILRCSLPGGKVTIVDDPLPSNSSPRKKEDILFFVK